MCAQMILILAPIASGKSAFCRKNLTFSDGDIVCARALKEFSVRNWKNKKDTKAFDTMCTEIISTEIKHKNIIANFIPVKKITTKTFIYLPTRKDHDYFVRCRNYNGSQIFEWEIEFNRMRLYKYAKSNDFEIISELPDNTNWIWYTMSFTFTGIYPNKTLVILPKYLNEYSLDKKYLSYITKVFDHSHIEFSEVRDLYHYFRYNDGCIIFVNIKGTIGSLELNYVNFNVFIVLSDKGDKDFNSFWYNDNVKRLMGRCKKVRCFNTIESALSDHIKPIFVKKYFDVQVICKKDSKGTKYDHESIWMKERLDDDRILSLSGEVVRKKTFVDYVVDGLDVGDVDDGMLRYGRSLDDADMDEHYNNIYEWEEYQNEVNHIKCKQYAEKKKNDKEMDDLDEDYGYESPGYDPNDLDD